MTGFIRKPKRWIELACNGVSVVFCMIASLSVVVASKDWLEEVIGDAAGPLLLVALLVGWIGGGMFLARRMVRWWDAGLKRRTGILLFLMIAAVPVLLVAVLPNVRRPWQRFDAEFGPHAAEYMARTRTGPQVGPNHIRGRCVVVSDRGVDSWMMSDMPRRLRAETAAEVRSVVQLRKRTEPLADPPTVQGSLPAPAEKPWIDKWLVTVLDADTGRVLAEETLSGTWRWVKVRGGPGHWGGALPSGEIAMFLRNLPQEKE